MPSAAWFALGAVVGAALVARMTIDLLMRANRALDQAENGAEDVQERWWRIGYAQRGHDVSDLTDRATVETAVQRAVDDGRPFEFHESLFDALGECDNCSSQLTRFHWRYVHGFDDDGHHFPAVVGEHSCAECGETFEVYAPGYLGPAYAALDAHRRLELMVAEVNGAPDTIDADEMPDA